MNKEIEETRKSMREQKALDEYVDTIKQQLADRGLSYVMQVFDEKSGNFSGGYHGRMSVVLSLMSDLIKRVMSMAATTETKQ